MFPVAVGLSVRDPWIADLVELRDRSAIDVLEVMIDDVICGAGVMERYRQLGARWPLIAHGVDLGIGNADGLDRRYVDAVAEATSRLRVRWYGDHLCFLAANGISLGHFAPVAADPETVERLTANGAVVAERITTPFILENPADVLGLGTDCPDAGVALGRSFGSAVTAAGAGALLDVTNLLYNARNDGFDAAAFIDALPLERVVQIHLAGGRNIGGLWIDSHDRPVEAESLALLRHALARTPNLRAVTIEWDENLPAFEVMLQQVARVRAVLEQQGRR
ncbi:MAG: DUF692 domain-containing protein [Deltaproteobacteria bacterium]|nr:DUF692 domain-containing protein [Deltaproteobacteria bacterium]